MPNTRYYLNREVRKMKPTQNHRPAVWECILGTVSAMDASGTVRYFDYSVDDAFEYAGFSADRDPRVWKNPGGVRYNDSGDGPARGKLVLWLKKA